ncbi:type II-A CRISPR-associated protein Csn2 [Phascolarctobacterium succinatutens]|uniref:type II-A CRISPR-associated protein Csn2 n=1 Tax=Phascolarctobacterium succinatutens TaxID=626940 RepID=UPI0026E9859F|nr:type II-A CRISPR-associated protein Csn2 [Phascolarctobacterium succinatutens]
MKLVYTELEQQLVFQENKVNVLVIEQKELFRRMIQELDKQISGGEGGFVLSDNNKTMKIDKEICLILNPFALEINSRKALTGLYNELGKLGLNEENYLKTCSLKGQIAEYIYDLLNQVDYALKFQDDFNLQSMFKALEVEFETGEGNFLEGLVYFLDVCSKFQKVKILTFVNLKTYLMSEELHEFYKEAFYRKIQLLLLENNIGDELAEEAVSIVDADLCLIK